MKKSMDFTAPQNQWQADWLKSLFDKLVPLEAERMRAAGIGEEHIIPANIRRDTEFHWLFNAIPAGNA